MKKIYFEDQGQDILWWEIGAYGIVSACGPFQGSIWIGSEVIAHEFLKVGDQLEFISKFRDGLRTLRYKIEKIESI
ncbi:hypothetical protein ABE545_10810 [Sphingobacterium faecium]|jgi:hypothetical protein|uniref:hypothetical protein n=1 Tax=Sphingobacterium faecium TaxID=34087 RepID=UPI003208AA95